MTRRKLAMEASAIKPLLEKLYYIHHSVSLEGEKKYRQKEGNNYYDDQIDTLNRLSQALGFDIKELNENAVRFLGCGGCGKPNVIICSDCEKAVSKIISIDPITDESDS